MLDFYFYFFCLAIVQGNQKSFKWQLFWKHTEKQKSNGFWLLKDKCFCGLTLTQNRIHNPELILLLKSWKAAKHIIKYFCGTGQATGNFTLWQYRILKQSSNFTSQNLKWVWAVIMCRWYFYLLISYNSMIWHFSEFYIKRTLSPNEDTIIYISIILWSYKIKKCKNESSFHRYQILYCVLLFHP